MKHLPEYILIALSVILLGGSCAFFFKEESEDYVDEVHIMTSEIAETLVDLTEDSEGNYYLMLPSMGEETAALVFDEDYAVEIDGNSVESGSSIEELSSGQHTISIKRDGNPFACTVGFTVMRAAEENDTIPTLYLEFSSGSLHNISQKKGETETCLMIAMDEEGQEEATGSCKAKVHGNTSWYNDKKSLALSFDEDISILGLGAQRKWLLISNYSDTSFLKNAAAYLLEQKLDVTYTPECRFVNVYVNGTYEGLYLLVQKIDADGGTVDIPNLEEANEEADAELAEGLVSTFEETDENGLETKGTDQDNNPDDITGGYLCELGGRLTYEENTAGFTTPHRYVSIRTPNNASREETAYIASFVREAEEALYSEEDSETLWTTYFDQTSWIQQYLLQEFTMNQDTELNSEYFWYAVEGDVLHGGPGWDFDLSFAGLTGDDSFDLYSLHVEGLNGPLEGDIPTEDGPLWLQQMDAHEDFHKAMLSYFTDTMAPEIEELLTELPKLADTIRSSAQMDNELWHKNSDFDGAVQELLSDMQERLSFMTDYCANEDDYVKLTFIASDGRYNLVYCVRKGTVLESLPSLTGNSTWELEDGTSVEPGFAATEDLTLYPAEESDG